MDVLGPSNKRVIAEPPNTPYTQVNFNYAECRREDLSTTHFYMLPVVEVQYPSGTYIFAKTADDKEQIINNTALFIATIYCAYSGRRGDYKTFLFQALEGAREEIKLEPEGPTIIVLNAKKLRKITREEYIQARVGLMNAGYRVPKYNEAPSVYGWLLYKELQERGVEEFDLTNGIVVEQGSDYIVVAKDSDRFMIKYVYIEKI